MKPSSSSFLRSASLAASIVLTLGQAAHAANYWFDQNTTTAGFGVTNGSSYDWNAGTSWTTDVTGNFSPVGIAWPGTTNQAAFVGAGTGGTGSYTVTLGATDASTVTLGNLILNSDGTNAAAIGSGNVVIGGVGGTGTLLLGAANSIGTAAGTLTINSKYDLGNNRSTNFRGGTVIINGVISGTGASGVTLGGGGFGLTTGTLTLNNTANTYAGVTTLQATGYTLAVTKLANGLQNSSIGASSNAATNLLFSGGTLKFIGTGAQTTDRLFRIGTNGAFLDASGTTTSDTMSWTNPGSPTYSATNVPHTLTLTGTNAGSNTYGGTLTDGAASPNFTNLTKAGLGKWVLTGSNTYTGVTTINAGTLSVATIGNGGVVSGNLGSATNAAANLVLGGGTLQYTGTTASTDRNFTLTAATTSTIDINTGGTTLTMSGASTSTTGNLIKAGAGTLELSGANLYTGTTKVTGGTLKLTNSLAIQSSAFDTSGAGMLDVTTTNTPTFGGLTSATNYALPSNVTSLTLNPGSGTVTYTGDLSRTGGGTGLTLTKTGAGTQVLGGTNSYSGDTAVNAGNLQIESAGALGSSANITVSATNNSALVLNNVITGSGKALTISGVGNGGFFGALSTPATTNTSSEWQGSVTIAATSGTRIGSQSGLLKISGNIGQTTAGSSLIIRNADTAGATLLSGNNNYTGGTNLFKGYLQLGSANAIGTGAGNLTFGGGFLSSDSATPRIILNPVAFNVTATAVTLGDAANAGKLTFTNTFDLGTAAKTLTLASDAEFSGIISGVLGGITKAGAGTLTLSNAANSYTGVTTFQTGIVNAAVLSDYAANGSFGNRASDGTTNVGLRFMGGTLQYNGSTVQSTNRSIRIGTAGGTIDASGSALGATMSFTKTTANVDFFDTAGARTLTLTGSNAGDNLFAINIQDQATSGRTTLAKTGNGTWVITNANNSAAQNATTSVFGGYGGGTTISGGTLAFANGAIGGGVVNFTGNSTLRWESGNTQDITTGSGSGVARSVLINDGVTATFNTNGNDVILSNALGVGSLATGAVTKSGNGSLTLSGTNTYTGATIVSGGKLVINGNISTSTTTVSGTGTLGGSGFAGAVNVESGGTLAPGNSIDQFDTTTLTLAAGSIFQVEIDSASSYDQLGITGDLNITSGAKLDLVDFGSPDLIALYSRLTIMDYSGAWNTGLFTLGTEELSDSETFAWQSKTWRINYNDILGGGETSLSSGGTAVTLTVVPEPNVAALLGGLGTLLLLRRRRNV
jgi:fibronectin-binding autotransporter adhesin